MSIDLSNLSLSHSAVDTLNRCARAYKYTYIEKRQRKGERVPLRRGKAFADALEHGTFDQVRPWYEQQIATSMEQERINDLTFEMLILEYLVSEYHNHHEPTSEREVEFDNPITGASPLRNKGRIDGLIKTGDSVVLVEDKLKQMWKRAEEAALPLNRQINRYIVEYEEMYGLRVDAVEYRVTKYPSSRPHKGENPTAAAERIISKLDPRKVFLTFTVEPSREGREVYLESLNDAVSRLQQHSETDTWDASGSALACSEPYPCDFLPRCMNDFGWEWEYEERTYN